MLDRCYQLFTPLLILSNLLFQNCQAPLHSISTEGESLDLSRGSEVSSRGVFSPPFPESHEGAHRLAEVSSSSSSQVQQIPVSNDSFVVPLPAVPSSTLAERLSSEQSASLSGTQITSATAHGVHVYPASSSSIVQDSDTFTQIPFRSYKTSSGECVAFRRAAGHWQAVLQSGTGAYASKRIMPVVSKGDIGETLSWIQAQDPCVYRSRIHLLSQFRPPYNLFVYLGKTGLLGGTPEREKKPGLAKEYYHERAERVGLPKEQVISREAYAQQLCSLEQTKEEYKRECELLRAECSDLSLNIEKLEDYRQQHESTLTSLAQERNVYKNKYEELVVEYTDLKSDIEELEDYKQQHESTLTSLARERDMYKNQYEGLRGEYSDLKSYVARYQGPERALFHPRISGAAFGREAWARYLGNTGAEPSLPPDIDTILHGKCPFWPDNRVRDTHLLVLIPATVCGRPFTLDLLENLTKNPSGGGHSARCCYESNVVKEELGSQLSSYNSYWMLITKSIVPDSQCKTAEEQELLVADYSRKTGVDYALPSPLEAATAILSHYVRSGERICPDYPRMYTRCAGKVDYIYPIYMGLFSLAGLNIGIDGYDASSLSVGTLCRWRL